MHVLIRPFRPIDLDGLFVLDYRCYARPYRFGYQRLMMTLHQAGTTTVVIQGEQEGDVIGGLIVRGEPSLRQATIVSLMIEPEFRRLGLGRRLAEWTLDFARRSGWDAVVVALERDNAAATAFVGALGFEDTGTAQPYFATPEVGTLWRRLLVEALEPQP